jgi:hypothetical protein
MPGTAHLKPFSLSATHAIDMLQVFTNTYSVGFGDINRGIKIKSEFLDTKWRALLTEIDLSYRYRNGTSELPFEIDQDITMCDWRNSFSDGLATYSFPVNWPIKPQHAMQFFAQNNYTKMYENSGHVASASWQNLNFMNLPTSDINQWVKSGRKMMEKWWDLPMPESWTDKEGKKWPRTDDLTRSRMVRQTCPHANVDVSTGLQWPAVVAKLLNTSLNFRLALRAAS